MSKTVKVKITNKEQVIEIEGIKEEFSEFEITNNNYIQNYRGEADIICHKKHNGCSHILIKYFNKMYLDRDSFIVGRRMFTEFNEWLVNIGNDPYKENTIWKSIQLLEEDCLILKLSKGIYRLNPTYYWKGPQAERINEIKYLIENNVLGASGQITQVKKSKIRLIKGN